MQEPEELDPKRGGLEPGKVTRGEEGARWRRIGDPRLPTEKEVEEHNLTHVPYRNWCPHCVRGLGKDLDHRKSLDASQGTARARG